MAKRSVVKVVRDDRKSGSGFFISKTRIVTANHVVDQCEKVKTIFEGKKALLDLKKSSSEYERTHATPKKVKENKDP